MHNSRVVYLCYSARIALHYSSNEPMISPKISNRSDIYQVFLIKITGTDERDVFSSLEDARQQ